MKTQFRKWFPASLALVGLGLLGPAPRAHAALLIETLSAQPGVLADRVFADENIFGANSPTLVLSDATGVFGDYDAPPPLDPGNDAIAGQDIAANAGGLKVLALGTLVSPNGTTSSGVTLTSNSPGGGTGGLSNAQLIFNSGTILNTTNSIVHLVSYNGDTGYTSPLSGIMNSTSSVTITNGSVRITSWDDGNNLQFGGNGSLAENPSNNAVLGQDVTYTNFTSVAQSFSNGAGVAVPFNFTGPYSKTNRFEITLLPGGVLSGLSASIQNAVVPEPASMALMGIGLTGAWGLFRRRKLA